MVEKKCFAAVVVFEAGGSVATSPWESEREAQVEALRLKDKYWNREGFPGYRGVAEAFAELTKCLDKQ